MLDARNLTVTLGRRTILDQINFSAQAGHVTSIVGPNGAGKSTLLKALTGDLAYKGDVFLNKHNVANTAPWQMAQLRAVLPQASQLAFPFTVLEVVRLGLVGAPHNSDLLIRQALAHVDLLGFEGRLYQELSGGEQQRIQLARVLLQVWEPVQEGEPRWLFLDEPVSSLDIGHQLQIMQIARDFADRGGGVVAVMHDLNLTARYSDRVALLHDGAVIADNTPDATFTDHLLSRAYGCHIAVNTTPPNGVFVLPQTAFA